MRRLILISLSSSLLTAASFTAAPAFAQTPASPPRMDGYPAVGAPATVTLLSAGSDPRQTPRVGPTVVRKDHMDITMKMAIAMEAGGMQMPAVEIPAMKIGMDLDVTEVKPNGDATVTMAMTGMTIVGPSPDPSFDEIVKTSTAQLKDVRATLTFNARGQLLSHDLKLPSLAAGGGMDSLKSSLEDSLKNMTPPMPEVPLGVGARWEVRNATESGGVVMFQKAVNEITALDKDSITIKSTIEQTAPAQTMAGMELPPGAEMRLESGSSTGGGTATLRFGEIVPVSNVNLKMQFNIMMTMNGQSVPMSMTMTVATTTAGAPIK